MDLGLAGKSVIVTGGASNIGHGITLAFAREGAHLVIADIDQPQAERTAELTQQLGGKALVVRTDVTDPDQTEALARAVVAEFGRIDVLVNNVGIGKVPHSYFREMRREDALRAMDVNFWGMFNTTKAVIEPMIAQGSGSIVSISSLAYLGPVYMGGVHSVPLYGAAKAAVGALSQSLAAEFAPHGIRVNVVAPGGVLPASAEQIGEGSSKWGPPRGVMDYRANAERAEGSGRLGHPDDIARIVVFLASEAASFMTGKVVVADGGADPPAVQQEKRAATQRAFRELA